MFGSIKTKMLLLVVGILAMTAVVLTLFTKKDIEQEMLQAERRSVQNVIYLLDLNIENQYKSLLAQKLSTINGLKEEMKTLTSMVTTGLDRFRRLSETGLIPEQDASLLAIDWIQAMRGSKNTTFFLASEDGTILSHHEQDLIGQNISRYKDIKEVSLLASIRHQLQRQGEGFTIFYSDREDGAPRTEMLLYFTAYPGWKWIVAAAVNIAQVEANHQRRLELVIKELKKTFSRIQIAKTGYLFLFTGKKKFLIQPNYGGEVLLEATNELTGHRLVDDWMAAAAHPEQPMDYLWKTRPGGGPPTIHESYTAYFKPLDWYIGSTAAKDEIASPAKATVLRQTLLICLICIGSIFITYLLVRRISQPLKQLADHARALPTHDFTEPEAPPSDIDAFPARYRDEVGGLAQAFVFMEHELRRNIAALRETTAAKERIESELKIARDIQMGILPKTFPAFPQRDEFEVYASLIPAREVGGDFYDFFLIDDDHLFFVIGDVSGKGIPASLFMAVTKTMLKAHVSQAVAPGEVLSEVNNKLAEDNDACVFVTAWCAVLNVRTGEVQYANGGHNPPMLLSRREGEPARFITMQRGVALGVMPDVEYRTERLVMRPGDVLFLYTDGITEAMNRDDELYSEHRLQQQLPVLCRHSLQSMSQCLMDGILAFAGEVPQADDITMLLLSYRGQLGSATDPDLKQVAGGNGR